MKRKLLACLLAGLVPPAYPLGLQGAVGEVVLGRAVELTIPLRVGPDERLDAACFRAEMPAVPSDPDYVLRQPRLRLEQGGGQARLIVASADPWQHPVLEFRILATCGGADVARDYVLLPRVPVASDSESAQAVGVPQPVTAMPLPALPPPKAWPVKPTPAAAATTATAAEASAETLTLAHATHLNALARQRYPHDRAARDEFRRLLAELNLELFVGKGPVGAVPLPAGTILRWPSHLPNDRNAGPPTQSPRSPTTASANLAAATPTTARHDDRLVVGGNVGGGSGKTADVVPAPALSPTDLQRLEALLDEHRRTQTRFEGGLQNLETTSTAMAQTLLALADRVHALDRALAEAVRVRQAAETRTPLQFGILEMLALIFSVGGVGAGLLYYRDRLQAHRQQFAPAATAMAAPLPDVAPPTLPIDALPPAAAQPAVAVVAPVIDMRRPGMASPLPDETLLPPTLPSPPPAEPDHIEWHAPALSRREAAAARAQSLSPGVAVPAAVGAPPLPSIDFDLSEDGFAPPSTWASSVAPVADAEVDALDLADVMRVLGLAEDDAQQLIERIRDHPLDAVPEWLRLLELQRSGKAGEDWSAPINEFKSRFNVATDETSGAAASLLDYRHLIDSLVRLWRQAGCHDFLDGLLFDTRSGTRQGFPRAVVEEIVLLRAILDEVEAD